MTRLVKFVGRLFADRDAAEAAFVERPCEASARIDIELSDREEARAAGRRDVIGFSRGW